MKAYIGFSATTALYGRLIRWFTRSKVNHSFIIIARNPYDNDFEDGKNMISIVQVDSGGVRFTSPESVMKNKSLVEIYDYTERESIYSGVQLLNDYVGSRYDWIGIIGFLIKIALLRLFKKNISNPIQRKGELFCSEYVASVLNKSGITFNGKKLIPKDTSPETLRKLILSNVRNGWRPLSQDELPVYLKKD